MDGLIFQFHFLKSSPANLDELVISQKAKGCIFIKIKIFRRINAHFIVSTLSSMNFFYKRYEIDIGTRGGPRTHCRLSENIESSL